MAVEINQSRRKIRSSAVNLRVARLLFLTQVLLKIHLIGSKFQTMDQSILLAQKALISPSSSPSWGKNQPGVLIEFPRHGKH
jgi:hypothetical protein